MSAEMHLRPSAGCLGDEGDAWIDGAAAEIRAFVGMATLAIACRVGRIILERACGGDVDAWRARGRKDVSLRKLAERIGKDGGLDASRLSRCVGTHLALLELRPVETWKHITPTHVVRVLPLPADRRAELLLRAEESRWSVSELALHARAFRRVKRRRARLPLCARTIYAIERMTAKEGNAFAGIDEVASLPDRERDRLHDAVITICQRMERLGWSISPKRLRHREHRPRAVGRA